MRRSGPGLALTTAGEGVAEAPADGDVGPVDGGVSVESRPFEDPWVAGPLDRAGSAQAATTIAAAAPAERSNARRVSGGGSNVTG